jgi:acyl-CoA reductase-like NAD-dependent aldehyde dehydrogenase
VADASRLPVKKTYKLFIGGAFPRSESGRTYEAEGQNVARGSRKDARDAVQAARKAQPGWARATAYNRGQVLYRLAEMVEARTDEFAGLCTGRKEVERTIDRIVWYAGWADKLPQVLGGSNPVAGPYFNFTVPEPTGVVAVLAPDDPPLLGLVTRVMPPLVGGNAVIAVSSETRPLAAIELAEAIATSDVPGGVINILTGTRADMAPTLASHMDVNAIDLCGATCRSGAGRARASAPAGSAEPTPDGFSTELEELAAENVKRIVRGRADVQSPWEISSFLELKTVWHPIGQ